jgi:hypothetical protein
MSKLNDTIINLLIISTNNNELINLLNQYNITIDKNENNHFWINSNITPF